MAYKIVLSPKAEMEIDLLQKSFFRCSFIPVKYP
jgi:hypothetical protein